MKAALTISLTAIRHELQLFTYCSVAFSIRKGLLLKAISSNLRLWELLVARLEPTQAMI